MSLRKPRPDAVLRNLPEAVHADLVRLLVEEGLSYADARDWLAKEHGVRTSLGALNGFWYSDCLRVKLSRAKAAADEVKDDLHAARPDFDRATLGAISQRVFELASSPGIDAGELAKLVAAVNDAHRVDIKREELSISKEKLELLKRKADEADKAKGALADDKLSPEEKMSRIRGIFGVQA